MLNCEEIIQSIEKNNQNMAEGIGIVPIPNIKMIRDRNATSVDLRLGRWFYWYKPSRTHLLDISKSNDFFIKKKGRILSRDSVHKMKNAEEEQNMLRPRTDFVPFDDKFILHPGRFVLGATLEWLRFSRDISGYVTGKSSWARRGLVIETASGIHPGFSGCLVLELGNIGEIPIALRPGTPMCQIFFHKLNVSKQKVNPGMLSGRRRPYIGDITPDNVMKKLWRPV